jgi:CBS domain-containing protein
MLQKERAMEIKDAMTSEINLISPSTTLAEAARIMRDDDVGAIPVAENDRLVGILTDRDIVIRAIADKKQPENTKAAAAMTDKVLYCFDDQSVEEVAKNMGDQQIRRLPVVTRDKRLVGIVSLGDLSTCGSARAAGAALENISEPSA